MAGSGTASPAMEKGETGSQAELDQLAEVYSCVWKGFGHEKAQEVPGLLAQFPLILEPVDFDLVLSAAALKARHAVSLADAFCAATALLYDGIVVTGDPEFRSLESLIDIHWV